MGNTILSYCVYKHTNLTNGKVYIGITCRKPSVRWGKNGANYASNVHFHNAILKYGWNDGFSHEILYDGLCKEDAEQKEIELISKYQSSDPRYGYNIALGGSAIGSMAESTKQKISRANTGKRRSPEARKKMSDVAKASSQERSERFTKIRAEITPWNSGKTMSEEQIDTIKGNTYQKVRCVELDTVYKSMSFAARALGLHQSNIYKVCVGKYKTTGGYHFEYVD